MRKVDKEYGKDWWFKVWGPDKLAADGIGHSDDWVLKAGEKWHGFGDLAEGFNLLDPIKSTIITPGLDVSGKFAKTGIPARIVTKFLAEHGVVVEKTGLYSFFIMFTIGITKGRWNTLLTALQQFKDDYDRNAPLWRILPEFCAQHPRYERMGLRDLCQAIHEMYAKGDIARLTTEMYLSDLHPAMKPSDAYAHIAHRETERVDDRCARGPHHDRAADTVPAGHPAADPGRALQQEDRRLPAVHARIQRRLPGLRHRRARPGGGRGRHAGHAAALLRRLREGLIRRPAPSAGAPSGDVRDQHAGHRQHLAFGRVAAARGRHRAGRAGTGAAHRQSDRQHVHHQQVEDSRDHRARRSSRPRCARPGCTPWSGAPAAIGRQ